LSHVTEQSNISSHIEISLLLLKLISNERSLVGCRFVTKSPMNRRNIILFGPDDSASQNTIEMDFSW
jgi:hypothetical protein